MPEKYVRRDGLPILLRHTGPTTLPESPPRLSDGPVIVCLHDAGLQSSVFSEFLSCIEAAGGNAIAFDLPGHGRSGSLDALASIGAMAEMARWVVEWCGIESPLLVGHGMGSLVALEWSAETSSGVDGVVLCGAGAALGVTDKAVETMRQVTRGKAPRPFDPTRVCKSSGPERMRQAYMEGIQTDPRATLGDLEAIQTWTRALGDASVAARKSSCALRIVSGGSEAEADRARAEAIARGRAGSSTHTLADAAHFLPLERAQGLAEDVLLFSRSVSTAAEQRS